MGNTALKRDELQDEINSLRSLKDALDKSQAIIEFHPNGEIITANDNFLSATGYSLNEIQGKHHSLFVGEELKLSTEYKRFWDDLKNGKYFSNKFKRINKSGQEFWIQATYNPVFDENGKVYKVVKFATEITSEVIKNLENEGQLQAINRSNAVIEFNLDGTILHANDNFLAAVGYSLDEIQGKHHRIFCDANYAASEDYKNFWERLNTGTFDSGEYPRYTKSGEEIWISASYNPILDDTGRPFKVVKFAADITEMKKMANLKQMVDLSPINTMMATPEGKLVYLNEKSKETLRKFESQLPAKVDDLIGNSIDWFHKNPAGPKNIIKEVSNLPHKAVIQFGTEKLDLLISPLRDTKGNYLGPMVCWDVVTDKYQLVSELTESSQDLGSAAEELLAIANQLASNAEEAAAQTGSVSTASEELNSGIQTVAANMEEMTASIREITKQTNSSSHETSNAMQIAESSNGTIKQLGESSQEIGNIIKVITSIAQQTNLLALNATIEAARAGEAGKGFAVVANEVKELAKQTANATVDISKKVEKIQDDSTSAVTSIEEITSAISKLNGIATSIASAMEEQSATTGEVSRVVNESSQGVKQIDENINQVAVASKETGIGANQTRESAERLSKIASRLKALVDQVDI